MCYECQEGTSSQWAERGKRTCHNWVFTRKPRRSLQQHQGQWGRQRARGQVCQSTQERCRRGGKEGDPPGAEALMPGRPPVALDPGLLSKLPRGGAMPIPAKSDDFHSPWARLDPTPRAPGPRPNTLRQRSPSRAMGSRDHNHGLDFFPFSTDHQLCKPWRIKWPARDDQNFGQSAMTQTGSSESSFGSSHHSAEKGLCFCSPSEPHGLSETMSPKRTLKRP